MPTTEPRTLHQEYCTMPTTEPRIFHTTEPRTLDHAHHRAKSMFSAADQIFSNITRTPVVHTINVICYYLVRIGATARNPNIFKQLVTSEKNKISCSASKSLEFEHAQMLSKN
jgi:hypothetical protein